MKKIKYFKAMKKDGKKWFAESFGEPMTVALTNGIILILACEYSRMDGWHITDTASGYGAQNTYIPNRNELKRYVNSQQYLDALARIAVSKSYEDSVEELRQYRSQFEEAAV